MLSIVGTYENGYLKLDKDYSTKNPVKVIVTFLEEVQSKSENGLALTDFSFAKSKKNLQPPQNPTLFQFFGYPTRNKPVVLQVLGIAQY
jgi:hypothetical protein